ncbi:MAG: hypothetical protein HQL01_00290 [Nitrospirae bacterium]|nr:hypothetical protein [Nitrospirota bacterium]
MADESVFKRLSALYIETDGYSRRLLSNLLQRRLSSIYVSDSGRDALEMYRLHKDTIDLVIIDVDNCVTDMPIVEEIMKSDGAPPIIIITDYNDKYHTNDKVFRNIIKPLNVRQLLEAIMSSAQVNAERFLNHMFSSVLLFIAAYSFSCLSLLALPGLPL